MKSHFLPLFEYDYWANQQVWRSISQKPLNNPKIENLFSHVLSAQKIWLNRCTKIIETIPLWDTQSDLANLMESNHEAWLAFLNQTEDHDFEQIIPYQTSTGVAYQSKIKDILTHLINHGTYHRGQMVLLLKPERETLPLTDFIFWVR
ncbi:MAG: DinB family protein [Bacteroidetes bacterium]|nr:DinB family protein [Bacteroidota bacterium]MBU1372491.1 DinB family protein [Bacteroidota bacterium]MBU1485100.1 DinB family protein [Bacteroidota bacterium]MBU1762039.1 DinB family protein [Bacteroidota bacterium]MBU2045269.1 DinB family protein [Bacteroidota bacterium]